MATSIATSATATTVMPAGITEADIALGKSALSWTLRTLTVAASVGSAIYFGWVAALALSVLSFLISWCASYLAHAMVSPEAFGALGSKLGAGYGSVRNLFRRKA